MNESLIHFIIYIFLLYGNEYNIYLIFYKYKLIIKVICNIIKIEYKGMFLEIDN